MNAINYFKMDIRLIRGALICYLFVPFVVIYFISKSLTFGLGFLFFFLVIVATVPFNGENSEKCDTMYYMLPSKISSMVLGRFLYLIITMIIVWIIAAIVMKYGYDINIMSALEVCIICIAGMVATIFCLLEYPLYYKFGIKKGNGLSMLLIMIPSFIVLSLPSILNNKNMLSSKILYRASAFTMSNKIMLPILAIVIISIVGIISYVLSCLICEKKEI